MKNLWCMVAVSWLAGAGLFAAQPTGPAGDANADPNTQVQPPAYNPSSNAASVNPGIVPESSVPPVPDGPPTGPVEPVAAADSGVQFWSDAGYIYYWIRKGPNPVPLLTTGDFPSLGRAGYKNTQVVEGISDFRYDGFNSARLAWGFWVQDYVGIELRGFLTEEKNSTFTTSSTPTGYPFLAVPFFNVQTNVENSLPLASSGAARGAFHLESGSRMGGDEANLLYQLYRSSGFRIVGAMGFRHFALDEDLDIQYTTAPITAGFVEFNDHFVPAPHSVVIEDRFRTDNNFYGGQFGLKADMTMGSFYLSASTFLGVGMQQHLINVSGYTRLFDGNGVMIDQAQGGLFAQRPILGHFVQSSFAVLPTIDLRLGYQLTQNLSASLGYNFLFLSTADRPGNQIDREIIPQQSPAIAGFNSNFNTAPPQLLQRGSEFWAQGLELALTFQF